MGRPRRVVRMATLTLRRSLAHPPASAMSRYAAAIDRRTFLSTLGVAVFTAPLAAEAQQAGRVFRVGLVSLGAILNGGVLFSKRWENSVTSRDAIWLSDEHSRRAMQRISLASSVNSCAQELMLWSRPPHVRQGRSS